MCTNGVFGYGLFGNGFMNPYLPTAGFLTSTLGHCPANIWPARNYTQMANVWTHSAAYPYGFYFNFSGRPQYVVADAFQMPYQTAMGLQTGGIYSAAPSPYQLQMTFAAMNEQAGVRIVAGEAGTNLQKAKSIAACKDQDFMKADDNKDLRDEAIALEKKADELLKQLEEAMKDFQQGKLSTEQAAAKVKVLADKAKELVGESDALYERIKEAQKKYTEKKTEEAAVAAEEAADGAGSSAGDGESSVTTTEGDKEIKGNDKLSAEYGVKVPVVATDDVELSSIVRDVKNHTSNDDDSKDYNKMKEMFTTGAISKGNVVEVMDDLLNSKNHDLYDGIYEMDNSREIMNYFIDSLKLRIKDLGEAGYLTAAEKSEVLKMISTLESGLGSGKDIKSSTTVEIGGKKMSGNDALKAIVAKLKGKGTQADFDAKITAKKTERENKAKKDFYKAHAKTRTVKDEKAALPAGLTYLPNSKQFQFKVGDVVLKAESYSKLEEKVFATKKSEVTDAWSALMKELDKNLK